ncbi:MAG: type II toxin-antitoxin system mRNA interferase toxin, RelE/StbE family [Parcubacteria group bacterium CG_4_10_14_0_2_um_filter_41_6]|nr:MAG: type II toxin-antitoxin system mRNA interferase toxin, RelE/StbE family [Parcubacteria group bacterium CG_4_10_14_0_2_um_filter_41_6]
MRVKISSKFKKQYKKLPVHIKLKAKDQEIFFVINPFNPRLETHKLHGRNRECWAYSIDRSYRIKFIFKNDGSVLYLNIGTHDEVY